MNGRNYILGALCLFVVSGARATSNTLDYAETFESYADGFAISGTNGWSSGTATDAVVSTDGDLAGLLDAYNAPCGLPLSATHSKVLELAANGTVTNQFDMAASQIVWVDYMALPVHGPLPDGMAGEQAAVAFNLDGHPAIWHYDLSSGSNRWSVIDDVAIQTWEWVRLTMKFDYQAGDTTNNKRYFQVRLNGILLTHSMAWTANDGTGSPNGSWFAMSSNPDRFGRFSSRVDEGIPAALDDLVVTTNNPLARDVVVASAHGQADPAVGTHSYTYGDTVSMSVTNDTLVQGINQFVCNSWNMAGNTPASGSGTSVEFTLTGDLTLTWLWATNNALTAQGTPVWWLADHGLTEEDDLADTDEDGILAWQEWVCDTDPANGDSVLQITGIETTEPGMQVYWKGGVLATQVLERCSNLVAGTGWVPLFTNAPPTSISTNLNDSEATNSTGFYRIKASR